MQHVRSVRLIHVHVRNIVEDCIIYNWGEPEQTPHSQNGVSRDVCMYVSSIRHPVNAPRVLIHCTA